MSGRSADSFERQPWLAAAGAIATVSGLGFAIWCWGGGLPYDTTSGVWSALADDFAHGVLYRDVIGPLGFGGTRYMPLQIVLQGGLARLGIPVFSAGLILTILSWLAIGAGVYAVLRHRVGLSRIAAVCFVGVLHASIAVQLLLVSTKGDLLASACSLWAFYFLSRAESEAPRPRQWLGGILAGLAVLTKFTQVQVLATFLVWRGTGPRPRRNRWIPQIAALAIVSAGSALANLASQGRMLESFGACVTGGAALDRLVEFPGRLVAAAGQDPFFCALFAAALVLAVSRAKREGQTLVTTYFFVSTGMTLVIFVSPGTDSNHLIDLLLAAIFVIGAETQKRPRALMVGSVLYGGVALAMWLPGIPSPRHFMEERSRPTVANIRELLADVPGIATKTIISENPTVPLVMGWRPRVLDAFSLHLTSARQPVIGRRFFAEMVDGQCGAVVLMDWSGGPADERLAEIERHRTAEGTEFFGGAEFPSGFLAVLRSRYRLARVSGPFVLFVSLRTPGPP